MSKYNLIDIFEQYKIGSGWTNDFDYDGMLNIGLKTSIDTPIEVLKKIFEDFTDVNYHREAEHLHYAIEAIEIGDMMEAQGKISDFHAEIKKTQGDQGMDMSDDLGAYMASKMDLDEDKYDDIVDADDDIPADKKKAAAAAYRKVDKGASYEKATSHIKEVRIDKEVADRIEGFLNIPMKAKFLNAFEDLIYDLLDDEPFYVDDVIAHLSNEMGKRIDGNQIAGDRLAGIDEAAAIDEEDSVEEGYIETKGKALYPILKAGANATGDEVEMYVKSLAKDIELNGKEQYKDFTSEDFVEDFKEYIADKSLQEHFKRFI